MDVDSRVDSDDNQDHEPEQEHEQEHDHEDTDLDSVLSPPRVSCTHENLSICAANLLTPEDVVYFHNKVHSMQPGDDQVRYLREFLKCYDTKGVRMKCYYYIERKNGDKIRVCQKTFKSVTRVTKTRIRNVHISTARLSTDENGNSSDVSLPVESAKSRRTAFNMKWYVLFQRSPELRVTTKFEPGKCVYPCLACLDMYNQLEGLVNHLFRRSYLIKYRCKFCSVNMYQKFYNSCQFLLHIRTHLIKSRMDNQMFNLNDVEISMLDADMANNFENSGSVLTFDKLIETTKFLRVSQMTQFVNMDKSNIFVELVDVVGVVCLDNTQKTRLSFYKFIETTQLPCKLLELNKGQSSIKVAQRKVIEDWKQLQRKKYPNYVSIFNSKKFVYVLGGDDYSYSEKDGSSTESADEDDDDSEVKICGQHVDVTDEDTNKSSCDVDQEYCTECDTKIDNLKDHFSVKKCTDKVLSYCTSCPWFTVNMCSFRAHLRFHRQEKPFTCPECGKVFDKLDFFKYHLTYNCLHLIKKLRIKCFSQNCRKFFTSIRSLRTHFWSAHLVVVSYFCEFQCKKMFFSQEQHPSECGEENLERMFHCSICPGIVIKAKDLGAHSKEHFQSHLINYIFVYFCDKCKFAFNKEKNFLLHREACSAKNKRKRVDDLPIYSDSGSSYQVRSVSSDNDDKVSTHSHGSNVEQDVQIEEPSSEKKKAATSTPAERLVIAASKKLIRVIRTCAVCSTEVDSSNFVEHIKSHRQSSTMYQCMECGECFAVKPSLEKHLKIEHKVEDFEDYISKNDCFDKEAIQKSLELVKYAPGECKEPLQPNQCTVCKKILPNEDLFQQHIRKHGLVFLRLLK